MNLSKLIDSVLQAIRENGPELLTAFGVVGVGTTAYLAANGGYKSARALSEESPYMSTKEKIQKTWPNYVPAVITGAGTATCIVLAYKGNTKRTVAAVAAYSVTEKAFADYREKMLEQISAKKEQKMLAEISQERVLANPPPSNGVIVLGRDEILMLELHTGRYFRSSVETINKAVNEINRYINFNRKASLSDFYNELGLAETEHSAHQGWTDEELLDITFDAVKTEDDKPALTIRYNYVKPLV